jgi:vacuolar-type H+-ATPase subunit H
LKFVKALDRARRNDRMQDILTTILTAEDAARTRIAEASRTAAELKNKADAEAAAILAEAKQRASAEKDTLLRQAKEEVESWLRAERQALDTTWQGKANSIEARFAPAIERALNLVLDSLLD